MEIHGRTRERRDGSDHLGGVERNGHPPDEAQVLRDHLKVSEAAQHLGT